MMREEIGDFATLVKRYKKPIAQVAYRITHDRSDADDIVQDTFVRAYARAATKSGSVSFGAWLMTIARNASIDRIRQRTSRERAYARADQTAAETPESLVLRADRADRLRAALASLSERYRSPVELYYFSNLSYREIGERLDLPLGTVKTNIARGLARLREDRSLVEAATI